jgi:signal peptidase I
MDAMKKLWRNHRGFLLAMGLMFVFRSAVADWNIVPTSSMNPTLISGDRVMINKLAYSARVPFTLTHVTRWSSPERGDVITFDSPLDGLNLIKRVVAVGGDVVAMQANQLIINGQVISRQLVDNAREIPTEAGMLHAQIWRERLGEKQIEVARIEHANLYRDFAPVVVPQGHVLVLGDSRDNSNDSRFIGFIDVRRVTGQAVRVVMSHNYSKFYLPRSDRWWLEL